MAEQPRPQPGAGRGDMEVLELSRAQAQVARRMAESKATIPHLSLSVDVDMEECVALRGRLEVGGDGPAPTLDDMVVKACALALRQVPRANGAYRDGRFELHGRVNVGIAVPAGDSIVVPTLFDADRKTLEQIAAEARALVARARDGTITPPDLSGATFTVASLGPLGVTSFTAVVNPPQAGILAVGAVAPRAVVRDGQLVARHTVTLTLSCDHRILYGAAAAALLAAVRTALEDPAAALSEAPRP